MQLNLYKKTIQQIVFPLVELQKTHAAVKNQSNEAGQKGADQRPGALGSSQSSLKLTYIFPASLASRTFADDISCCF